MAEAFALSMILTWAVATAIGLTVSQKVGAFLVTTLLVSAWFRLRK
jgi:hypothetical protein